MVDSITDEDLNRMEQKLDARTVKNKSDFWRRINAIDPQRKMPFKFKQGILDMRIMRYIMTNIDEEAYREAQEQKEERQKSLKMYKPKIKPRKWEPTEEETLTKMETERKVITEMFEKKTKKELFKSLSFLLNRSIGSIKSKLRRLERKMEEE